MKIEWSCMDGSDVNDEQTENAENLLPRVGV